jgi:hypothetical protein
MICVLNAGTVLSGSSQLKIPFFNSPHKKASCGVRSREWDRYGKSVSCKNFLESSPAAWLEMLELDALVDATVYSPFMSLNNWRVDILLLFSFKAIRHGLCHSKCS